MNYESDPSNPYAAPSAGAEAGARRGFALSDEIRKLISTTATLMIVGGILQLIPGVASIVIDGVAASSFATLVLFGVVPAFTAIAGFSLRSLSRPGDDLGALLAGFRQLHVAYLVKGIALLLMVALTLLGLAFAFLGVGIGFFSLWS